MTLSKCIGVIAAIAASMALAASCSSGSDASLFSTPPVALEVGENLGNKPIFLYPGGDYGYVASSSFCFDPLFKSAQACPMPATSVGVTTLKWSRDEPDAIYSGNNHQDLFEVEVTRGGVGPVTEDNRFDENDDTRDASGMRVGDVVYAIRNTTSVVRVDSGVAEVVAEDESFVTPIGGIGEALAITTPGDSPQTLYAFDEAGLTGSWTVGAMLGVELWPVAEMNDGRILLRDHWVSNNEGARRGPKSGRRTGLWIFDRSDTSMTPAFIDGTGTGISTASAVSYDPDNDSILFLWGDETESIPTYSVSRVPADSAWPVDPQQATVVFEFIQGILEGSADGSIQYNNDHLALKFGTSWKLVAPAE